MRASGVYAILNLFDGKIYIGSSIYIKSRFAWHHRALFRGKHHSILLQRAYDKYGDDNFIFFVIEVTEDLLTREQYWMDRFCCYHPDSGYNLYFKAGSPSGRKHTEEHKRKIGEASKGRSFYMVDYIVIKYILVLLLTIYGVQSASAKHWPSKSLMKECSVDLTQMKDGWKKTKMFKIVQKITIREVWI